MQSLRRFVGALARFVQVPDGPPDLPQPACAPPVDPAVDDCPEPIPDRRCPICGRRPAFIALHPCGHRTCAVCSLERFAGKSFEYNCPVCHDRLTKIAREPVDISKPI